MATMQAPLKGWRAYVGPRAYVTDQSGQVTVTRQADIVELSRRGWTSVQASATPVAVTFDSTAWTFDSTQILFSGDGPMPAPTFDSAAVRFDDASILWSAA